MANYLVVTVKSWNIENFNKFTKNFEGNWFIVTNKEELNLETIKEIKPRYIFFIHWSWFIPKEIFDNFECVLFHMTDLPFGRGGSPLQNLIVRGIYKTKISALRVTQEIDAGDIYLKKPLDIEQGTAEEIFRKTSVIIYMMIKEIITKEIIPTPQEGEVVLFTRRKKEDSNMISLTSIREIYDYIRMLDAEGYPRAFLELNNIKIEFLEPKLKDNKIEAKVSIKEVRQGKNER